jgi:uncharacterized YigZ family protein
MPDATDIYRIPARSAQTELREKGSRFIAEVFVVDAPAEAEERTAAVRRREYAATHHCTAYRVGVDGSTFRYNDDGEPSGTAGLPILRQIDARGLTQTLVVVTRYFGGTKLGTGGLARAYGAAAAEALDAAGILEREIRTTLRIAFAYDDTAAAMHVINRFDARIEASDYSDRTVLAASVRRSTAEAFQAALLEALGGRGEIDGPK